MFNLHYVTVLEMRRFVPTAKICIQLEISQNQSIFPSVGLLTEFIRVKTLG